MSYFSLHPKRVCSAVPCLGGKEEECDDWNLRDYVLLFLDLFDSVGKDQERCSVFLLFRALLLLGFIGFFCSDAVEG